MLEVKNGKIFVEGVETIDPELIGMAFMDFAENISKNNVDCELQLKDNHFDNDYGEIIFIPKKLTIMKNLLKQFASFIQKKFSKKVDKKQVTQDLKQEIAYNIEQYKLIQEKKSDLPRSKRDQVERNIAEYVRVGHIKLMKA